MKQAELEHRGEKMESLVERFQVTLWLAFLFPVAWVVSIGSFWLNKNVFVDYSRSNMLIGRGPETVVEYLSTWGYNVSGMLLVIGPFFGTVLGMALIVFFFGEMLGVVKHGDEESDEDE